MYYIVINYEMQFNALTLPQRAAGEEVNALLLAAMHSSGQSKKK